jgi:hypothetical protein
MNETQTLPAPVLSFPVPAPAKWAQERAAFAAMHVDLMTRYRNQYVAVHEGQVVASGGDKIRVALQAYQEHGHVPIYVGLVSDEPLPPARLPTPRTLERLRT